MLNFKEVGAHYDFDLSTDIDVIRLCERSHNREIKQLSYKHEGLSEVLGSHNEK